MRRWIYFLLGAAGLVMGVTGILLLASDDAEAQCYVYCTECCYGQYYCGASTCWAVCQYQQGCRIPMNVMCLDCGNSSLCCNDCMATCDYQCHSGVWRASYGGCSPDQQSGCPL